MKMEQPECSETLAYKIQSPENYPEENIQHTEHSESLKSRILAFLFLGVEMRGSSTVKCVSCFFWNTHVNPQFVM
jgi:hypothetical protein